MKRGELMHPDKFGQMMGYLALLGEGVGKEKFGSAKRQKLEGRILRFRDKLQRVYTRTWNDSLKLERLLDAIREAS